MPRVQIKSGGRVQLKKTEVIESDVRTVSTGSQLLNLVLSGGWAVGRVVNVVGDRSSGKTLLAIEACANFENECTDDPDAIRYGETEAAFDHGYARSIGMPRAVTFVSPPMRTVEDFYADLSKYANRREKEKRQLGLYVLDSLDALSDEAEMDRDIDKGSFGAAKAKKMSETFRRINQPIEASNTTLFIISQIRDKIGVMFGETKTRSGGRALDFYATQIIWLAEVGKIKRTVLGMERVVGVKVLVKCRKNKIGPAHRECVLFVYYNYGVDDEESMIEWLRSNPKAGVDQTMLTQYRNELGVARRLQDRKRLRVLTRNLTQAVKEHWYAIDDALMPPLSKYGKS